MLSVCVGIVQRPSFRGIARVNSVIRACQMSTGTALKRYQLTSQNIHSNMAISTTKTGEPLNRDVLDAMLRRRLFYTPAFEVYGGVKGLFDYGPPGCGLQANIIEQWRRHFVLEEDMLEVDCTMLTPADVLKTSGHVDKFADFMCKDPKSGEIFRADHLVEEILEGRLKGDKEARGQKVEVDEEKEAKKKKRKADKAAIKLDDKVVQEYEEILAKIDNYSGGELGQLIVDHQIKNPNTGGDVLPPIAFNLMFQTQIGPAGGSLGYLRPETAQGQFLTFQKLLEFNQQSMPFASACIGKSFRNEISPRSGLLRVREFMMAEIEHYVDPQGGKKHPRFDEVKDVSIGLLDRHVQLSGRTDVAHVTMGEAVAAGTVDSETLGYFVIRIYQFLLKIGADPKKIRFRQHMANEMAHYASDCWDAELLTSYGWIECVGCADRSAYDLTVHAKKTGQPLCVRETLSEPLVIEEYEIDIDKKKFGPQFKKDGKAVEAALEELTQEMREKLALDLKNNGKIEIEVVGVSSGKVEVNNDLVKIEKRARKEHVREYTPNVVEPAFGIGRIQYSVIEHVYWSREGSEERGVSLDHLSWHHHADPFRRCSRFLQQLRRQRSYLYPCQIIRTSGLWFSASGKGCVSWGSLTALMTPQPVSESVIQGMTNWGRLLASPWILCQSRTTRLLSAIETARNKSEQMRRPSVTA